MAAGSGEFAPRPGLHGRRKGKKLRAAQTRLLAETLPRLKPDDLDPGGAPLWLEIGFGGGEHLIGQALAHRDTRFIGCEPFVNGVASALGRIEIEGLGNVRVHAGDAWDVLERLPSASVDRIYVLFPDPWPKRRQRKRRFVNEASIAAFARVLKPGALLRFATDIDDYAGWTLARLLGDARFTWRATGSADWMSPWADHVETRYERKARENGRTPVYLEFARI